MTSNERSDISPDNRLFIQQLVQANTNENITAAHHIRVIHMWKENSAQMQISNNVGWAKSTIIGAILRMVNLKVNDRVLSSLMCLPLTFSVF